MLHVFSFSSLAVSKRSGGELQVVKTTAAARCAPLSRAPAFCSGIDAAEDYPFYGVDAWPDYLDGLARVAMEANYSSHPSLDPAPSTECVAAMKALTCARYFCALRRRGVYM